jgi:hypothetical protein
MTAKPGRKKQRGRTYQARQEAVGSIAGHLDMLEHPPKRRRRRKRETLPAELERLVLDSAARLVDEFGPMFTSNRRLKHRLARLLASVLPPRRWPGRPGFVKVTAAIRLRDKLRRSHPNKSAKWVWRRIYLAVIPGYDTLPLPERQTAEDWLRSRVRWRLYARRRAA